MDSTDLLTEVNRLPSATGAEQGILSLLQGIAYSIRRATELGFDGLAGIDSDQYRTVLRDTGAMLKLGRDPEPVWLSGFFFNSAVIRIAAASHRAFRLLFRVDTGGFRALANRAVKEGRVTEAEISQLIECHLDVNEFKHDADALLLFNRRIATVAQATDAANQLVRLVKLAV